MLDARVAGRHRPRFWSPKRRGVLYLALASTLLILNLPPAEVASGPSFAIAHQESFKRVPIVMVVFDEFPAVSVMDRTGAVDERLYPNLARLAATATWYRNTATTAVFTHEALPAILTGRPAEVASTMEDIHPRNLFTLLGGAYDVRTYEDLPGFCPKRFCDLERPPRSEGDLGPAFSSFGRGERGTWWGLFLDMIEPAKMRGPTPFYFSHLVHPHAPWRYLPTGQRYLEDQPVPGEVDIPGPGKAWGSNRWLTDQMWQRHLMQAAQTDRLIGSLIDRLQETGIYDDALVIVTADHGVAFEADHPKRRIDSATHRSRRLRPSLRESTAPAPRVDRRLASNGDRHPSYDRRHPGPVGDLAGVGRHLSARAGASAPAAKHRRPPCQRGGGGTQGCLGAEVHGLRSQG